MKRLFSGLLLFSFLSSSAFGHGEDKLGPNKGYIRMPGAFHTELVPIRKNRLKVFLLDISWKNPSVKDASLEIRSASGEKAVCEPKENLFFDCRFSSKVDFAKKGELTVTAKRESQQGNAVKYNLPLKLEKIDDGHGGHH